MAVTRPLARAESGPPGESWPLVRRAHGRGAGQLALRANEELARLVKLPADHVPSDGELRVLQTQIVGWLEGLLAGMQMATLARSLPSRPAARAPR